MFHTSSHQSSFYQLSYFYYHSRSPVFIVLLLAGFGVSPAFNLSSQYFLCFFSPERRGGNKMATNCLIQQLHPTFLCLQQGMMNKTEWFDDLVEKWEELVSTCIPSLTTMKRLSQAWKMLLLLYGSKAIFFPYGIFSVKWNVMIWFRFHSVLSQK